MDGREDLPLEQQMLGRCVHRWEHQVLGMLLCTGGQGSATPTATGLQQSSAGRMPRMFNTLNKPGRPVVIVAFK